jgi:RNA recognition motif-containing protein
MSKIQNIYKPSTQNTFLSTDSDSDLNSTDSSPPRSSKSIPIPKDNKLYAQAKRAEYQHKNLKKAEILYKKAIKFNDRKLSAIKDLASLMNQQGKTEEAIILLKNNEKFFKYDRSHYLNLISTLENHLNKQDKFLKKSIKISFLSTKTTEEDVFKLFNSHSRIQRVLLDTEISQGRINHFCIIHFNSQSSARKTLEGFKFWDVYIVQWVSESGKVLCDAHYAKQKIESHRLATPTFEYKMFDKDSSGYIFCLAIDDAYLSESSLKSTVSEERLIGKELLQLII